MSPFMRWGVDAVLALQRLSPALDSIMRVITHLGDAGAYLALAALLHWTVDRRLARRTALLLVISFAVNITAKALANQPRPFALDARVLKLVEAGGGGLPSGHAQNAVVVWGTLARWAKHRLTWAIAFLMIGLVSISRVYLGVHLPVDIAAGLAIGASLLALTAWLERRLGPRWNAQRRGRRLLVAALAGSIVLVMLAAPAQAAHWAPTAVAGTVAWAAQRRWLRVTPADQAPRRRRAFGFGALSLAPFAAAAMHLSRAGAPAACSALFLYPALACWSALGLPWSLSQLRLVTTH